MSRYRRIGILVVVLVMVLGVYHGLSSYNWSSSLQTPPGVRGQTVSYTCGPPWGSAYVHGPSTTLYPTASGRPCGQRSQYRGIIVVDLVIGVLAIGALAGWPRRLRAQPAVA